MSAQGIAWQQAGLEPIFHHRIGPFMSSLFPDIPWEELWPALLPVACAVWDERNIEHFRRFNTGMDIIDDWDSERQVRAYARASSPLVRGLDMCGFLEGRSPELYCRLVVTAGRALECYQEARAILERGPPTRPTLREGLAAKVRAFQLGLAPFPTDGSLVRQVGYALFALAKLLVALAFTAAQVLFVLASHATAYVASLFGKKAPNLFEGSRLGIRFCLLWHSLDWREERNKELAKRDMAFYTYLLAAEGPGLLMKVHELFSENMAGLMRQFQPSELSFNFEKLKQKLVEGELSEDGPSGLRSARRQQSDLDYAVQAVVEGLKVEESHEESLVRWSILPVMRRLIPEAADCWDGKYAAPLVGVIASAWSRDHYEATREGMFNFDTIEDLKGGARARAYMRTYSNLLPVSQVFIDLDGRIARNACRVIVILGRAFECYAVTQVWRDRMDARSGPKKAADSIRRKITAFTKSSMGEEVVNFVSAFGSSFTLGLVNRSTVGVVLTAVEAGSVENLFLGARYYALWQALRWQHDEDELIKREVVYYCYELFSNPDRTEMLRHAFTAIKEEYAGPLFDLSFPVVAAAAGKVTTYLDGMVEDKQLS